MKRFGFIIIAAVLVSAGAAYWHFQKDARLDPVESAAESSSVETASRLNRVESSTQQGRVENSVLPVVVAEMPVVETAAFTDTVRSFVTPVFGGDVVGIVVSNEPSSTEPGISWEEALMDLTAVNAGLAGVEKMASKTGMLPEAEVIEQQFSNFEDNLTALKSRSLPDAEREQIRESLKKSTGPMLKRIHHQLDQRAAQQGNHLVHLAQMELARAMESLQGF